MQPTAKPYKSIYTSRIEAALSACRTVERLAHQGEKGRVREILIASLFRPLLPADLGVGTGFVVSADGQISDQQDVILYDKATLPPALFDESTGFFPLESVLHTIEVKTKLTRGGLQQAHDSALRIAGFPILNSQGLPGPTGPRPNHAIFALASDLSPTGILELDRYHDVVGSGEDALNGICVADRGYWWKGSDGWHRWPKLKDECIAFVGGIINGLPHAYAERRAARFSVGTYLMDFGDDLDVLTREVNSLSTRFKVIPNGTTRTQIADMLRETNEAHSKICEIFSGYVQEALDPKLVELRRQLELATAMVRDQLKVLHDDAATVP